MSGIVCTFESPSYSDILEKLEFILGISAFNEDIKIIFMKNSLSYLMNSADLQPDKLGVKNFVKIFGMLELYDLSEVYYQSNEGEVISIGEMRIRPCTLDDCFELFRNADFVL